MYLQIILHDCNHAAVVVNRQESLLFILALFFYQFNRQKLKNYRILKKTIIVAVLYHNNLKV